MLKPPPDEAVHPTSVARSTSFSTIIPTSWDGPAVEGNPTREVGDSKGEKIGVWGTLIGVTFTCISYVSMWTVPMRKRFGLIGSRTKPCKCSCVVGCVLGELGSWSPSVSVSHLDIASSLEARGTIRWGGKDVYDVSDIQFGGNNHVRICFIVVASFHKRIHLQPKRLHHNKNIR